MMEILLLSIGFFLGIFINQIITLVDTILQVVSSQTSRLIYKKEDEKQKVGFFNE